MRNIQLLYIFLILNLALQAQYDHIPVLSDLEGEDLLFELQDNYTPSTVMSYSQARDTMFAIIDNVKDTVQGVYTGFNKYLDPLEDPTTYLFQGIGSINTEHTYPQSKGAEFGPAKSNIHHLFPTRTEVNSARGSDIFAEINDNETQSWYYDDEEMSSIPDVNIDAYSESVNGRFEPRESHKGNVARAMFYFYTVYRNQAVSADSEFFDLQKETLCEWHYFDPVDEQEWNRTFAIATYQDGKENPFVLDCSLASRLYCPENPDCKTLKVFDPVVFNLSINPNPSSGDINVNFDKTYKGRIQLSIVDQLGRNKFVKSYELHSGKHRILVQEELQDGLYYIHITPLKGNLLNTISKKIVIKK